MSKKVYSVKPGKVKIDDQFWFDMSEEMISGAIKRITDGAEKVQEGVVWAFGIYTGAGTLLSFTYGESQYIPFYVTIFVLCLPYFILYKTYWASTEVQLPSPVAINYRMPDRIKQEYKRVYIESHTKLETAKNWFVCSLIAFSFCLTFAVAGKFIPKVEEGNFLGEVLPSSNKIILQANLPPNQIFFLDINQSLKNKNQITFSDTLMMGPDGNFDRTFTIDSLSKSILVQFRWLNDEEYYVSKSKNYLLQ